MRVCILRSLRVLRTFTMYADNSVNCPVSHQNLASNVCARARFPPGNGNPFETISFNIDNAYTTNDAKKRKVLTHELGHCIGFRHTNWQVLGESSATLIPETPSTDNNSLMNGGECGLEKVLSVYDRIAVNELYRMAL